MSNSISFTGRLGRDPEVKNISGTSLVEFSVANNVGYGEKKSTNWFKCCYWGKAAEAVGKYLSKGKEVFVAGELSEKSYTKDGVEKKYMEVRVDRLDLLTGREGANDASQVQPDVGQGQVVQKQTAPGVDADMPF